MIGTVRFRNNWRVFFWLFLINPIDRLVMQFKRIPPRLSGVLIVRLDNIGDFALWATAGGQLRNKYPASKYRITFLCNRAYFDLAKKVLPFDEFWPCDRDDFLSNPFYRLKLLARVRSAGFAEVINPVADHNLLREDSVVRVSGAEVRTGIFCEKPHDQPTVNRIVLPWYTQIIEQVEDPPWELERNFRILDIITGGHNERKLLDLHQLRGERPPALRNVGKYFVLAVGAYDPARAWPFSNFVELAKRISKSYEWTCVLCGNSRDLANSRELSKLGFKSVNLIGKTSISEFISILGSAEVVFSNESAALHLSASLGTKVISIVGGGHFGRFVPYQDIGGSTSPLVATKLMDCFNCGWLCRYPLVESSTYKCIAEISVQQVFDLLQK